MSSDTTRTGPKKGTRFTARHRSDGEAIVRDELSVRAHRKRLYEGVLRVVEYNTTPGVQPPGARRTTITRTLTPPEGDYPLRAVERAIGQARANDELLSWPTPAERPRYTLAEPDAVRQIAVWEAQRDEPRTELVAWVNQTVADLEAGDG